MRKEKILRDAIAKKNEKSEREEFLDRYKDERKKNIAWIRCIFLCTKKKPTTNTFNSNEINMVIHRRFLWIFLFILSSSLYTTLCTSKLNFHIQWKKKTSLKISKIDEGKKMRDFELQLTSERWCACVNI